MEMPRRVTAEFNREAVLLLKTFGKPAAVVARELDIPRNRLHKWAADAEHKGDQAFRGRGRPKASQDELAVLRRELARVKEENESPKKGGGVLRAGVTVRYAWIKAQPGHSIRALCEVLGVSTSGYYAWRRHEPSARALDSAPLPRQLERIHVENREACGTMRVWRSLRREGERCGVNRVRRLRQTHAFQTRRRRRYLQAAGFIASMSRKGMPYDNAMMASFYSSLKQELTHHERFVDCDEARSKVFDYIDVFYNRQRLHSGLDCQSPEQFENMVAAA